MAIDITRVHSQGPATDQLGRTLARAFRDAPDYSHILSGHPDKTAALAWFFGVFATRLVLQYGKLLATPDGAAGILTFAPGQAPSTLSVLRAGLLAFPRHFGWKSTWRAWLLGMHMEKRRLKLAPSPHWYILAVGVAPEKQGYGMGHELVSQIIRHAEIDGVPVYLEAFEDELVAHYERRGFVILHEEILRNGLHLRYLQRPVSSIPSKPATSRLRTPETV